MKNKKLQHIGQAGYIIFLSAFLVLNFYSYAIAKDSAEISRMIGGLSGNLSIDNLKSIYNEIGNLQDASAQSELKQELHQKLDEIFGVNSAIQDTEASTEETASDAEVAEYINTFENERKYTAIKLQIKALELGPEANAETMRWRDDLVFQINNLPDPDKREELLRLLEEKEQAK